MKKILFLSLISLVSLFGLSSAQRAEGPRVDNSAYFEGGDNFGTTVLTDEGAEVFVEFPAGIVAMNIHDRTRFTGEILPPAVIPIPARTPKTRMKELVTFELLSDAGEKIAFIDKVTTLNERNRLRLLILNPNAAIAGPRVQVVFELPKDESVRNPELWEFLGEDEGWIRIGGFVDETEDSRVFSVRIYNSGIFSIIDANPLPTDSADDYKIPETIESLSNKIERLESQRLALLALENQPTDEEEFLPPFLSDEAFDDFGEGLIDPLPALEVPGIPVEGDIDVLAPPVQESLIVPSVDPDSSSTASDETASAEFDETAGYGYQLPTAGPESVPKNEGNTFIWVLLGLLAVVGGSIWWAFRSKPY